MCIDADLSLEDNKEVKLMLIKIFSTLLLRHSVLLARDNFVMFVNSFSF